MAHKPILIVLILSTFAIYGAFLITPTFILNGSNTGFFENGTIPSDIVPARWVFGVVWGTIFIYQIIWLIYSITTIFRKSDGGFLYYAPPYMPPQLYIFFSLACLFLIVWYYFASTVSTVGRSVSCALLYTSTFMLYLAMFFTFKSLNKYKEDLREEGKDLEVRLVRGMVLNGLGEFATWASLASMLNLDTVLVNDADFDVEVSGTIILSCVALDVIVWVILDNFVYKKYTQYLLTPYLVLIIATLGIIIRHWDPQSRNSILAVVLFVLVIIATIIKLVLLLKRRRTQEVPVQRDEKTPIAP